MQPAARDTFKRLLAQGWMDAARQLHPAQRMYVLGKRQRVPPEQRHEARFPVAQCAAGSEARGASFPLDIEETESAYQLTADLPGLEKSDINIDLHENTRTISRTQRGAFNRGARSVA